MPKHLPPDTRPRWPAMITSLGMHVLVLLGMIWLLASRPSQGTVEDANVRSVGMAIAHRMPDRTRYVTEPEETAKLPLAPQSSTAAAATAPAPPKSTSKTSADASSDSSAAGGTSSSEQTATGIKPPIDLSKILAEMTGTGSATGTDRGSQSGSGAGGPASLVHGRIRFADGRTVDQLGDRELVPGVARSGQGAGTTTTQVFGVSGTGSTFVYVFDRSESMKAAGSAPLRASKTELIRSLETLTERQQFQIIFYNDSADVFRSEGDRIGLVTGEEATIERAKEFVRRTTAIGGTEHETALRMALRLAPDVIFFLTDAKIQTMSQQQLDDITRRAENAGTTIHAIQFGTGPPPANTFLERLVRRNGGGYRYVDVTTLP
ncbi:vWA domain-containing protein [Aporhodopirellula aestuarii]|uniref:VWFA domain-containing protein n=1 Tax=Aporhodopirellula aestuarii TaxID=2950107 RepID=A0ABT0U6D9_9BACT|nr:hypothetical protein [Aporhodopirellula aestuarii]MCM2372481.1 hypothetical protein [Aporhodopirellula aestuarii]